jgi:hypothetical protein
MMTEPSNLWQVREYDAARDEPTALEWAASHNVILCPPLLSPASVVVERDGIAVAMAWMLLCVGVPLAIIDKCLMCPGNTLAISREATKHVVESLKEIARHHEAHNVYTFTPSIIAQELEKLGGIVHPEPLVGVTLSAHPSCLS